MIAHPTLRASIRTLPRPAWVLFAGTFVNRFGSFLAVYLVLFMVHRGYSPAQAGLALGAAGLGAIAANAIGGSLADRFSRRGTIALSMISSAALTMLVPFAPNFPSILALVGMVGVAASMYRPAAGAILADVTTDEQRVAAFGINRFFVNTGFALGPAVAGFLAERSYVLLFAGDALTSLVFGAVAVFVLPETKPSEVSEQRPGQGWADVLRDTPFMFVLAGFVLGALVYAQSNSTFSLEIAARGLPASAYGLLISLNGLMIILFELPLISVTQRLPARPVMAAGLLVTGAGFALTALAPTLPLLAATVAVWTLGEMLAAPVGGAYSARIAPAHLRARYQAAWGIPWSVGAAAGPVLGSLLYIRGAPLLWGTCGALGAVGAALVMAGRPARRNTAAGTGVPGG